MSHPRHRLAARDEGGTIAILVAVCLTMLLIATAMVLDFGLARVDRQTNKAQADSAAVAGARAMGADFTSPKPWVGVCTAVRYLKAQYGAYTISDAWSDGVNAPVSPTPCNDSTRLATACSPSSQATWAKYRGTVGDPASPRLLIEVRAGYDVNDPAFPEESSFSTLVNDRGRASAGGCDNLAVIVTQKRKPGLGSLATSGDVTTRIRSVGRVDIGQNGKAPVGLLILEQTDCSAISTDGSGVTLFVKGAGERPGLIHSDSLGTTPGNAGRCNSSQIVGGGGKIKAFKAETGGAPGVIGIRALLAGAGGLPAKAFDPPPYVEAEGAPGSLPEGRPLVTRAPVDERYLSAVTNKVSAVWPKFSWTQAMAEALGYQWISPSNCGGSGIQPTYTKPLVYINCPGGATFATSTFNGTSMIVNGSLSVKNNETLRMPNATELYVKGPGAGVNAIGVDIGGTLALHDGNQSSCALADSATSGRAELVVGSGFVKQGVNDSVLRLCHTTVLTLGNDPSMPPYQNPAPAPSDNARNGNLSINGGLQDWSAPNSKPGLPSTQADWDNFEDLAMWTETSAASEVGGNGDMTLKGVFMLPNSNPFKIGGNGHQVVTNSQYVVRKLLAAGTSGLLMAPDPNDAIQVDYFGDFVLVR